MRGTTDAEEAAADQVIADLRTKSPNIVLEKIRTPVAGEVMPTGAPRRLLGVLKVVDQGTWSMVNEKMLSQDPAQRATVDRLMFNACVVYPAGQELAAMLRRYPAIVKVWAGEATEMAGSFKGSEREKV